MVGGMFDDTLTDREFAEALRESPLESVKAREAGEPDLSVDGLRHSLVSRVVGWFLPKAQGQGQG